MTSNKFERSFVEAIACRNPRAQRLIFCRGLIFKISPSSAFLLLPPHMRSYDTERRPLRYYCTIVSSLLHAFQAWCRKPTDSMLLLVLLISRIIFHIEHYFELSKGNIHFSLIFSCTWTDGIMNEWMNSLQAQNFTPTMGYADLSSSRQGLMCAALLGLGQLCMYTGETIAGFGRAGNSGCTEQTLWLTVRSAQNTAQWTDYCAGTCDNFWWSMENGGTRANRDQLIDCIWWEIEKQFFGRNSTF